MRSKNTASHIGHIGKKPELKKTPNGTPYTRFSIACNYSYKQDGQRVQDVDWIPFIAYGKLAEIAVNYLEKGSHVSVESRLKPWKSTKGDITRYGINVVATDILFLDPKDQAASPEEVADPTTQNEPVDDNEVPF